jgi:ribosomal protein S18 acetylase RimI-like enzyme
MHSPRPATLADLDDLVRLENRCFTSDRLSRRSFRHFITRSHGKLWVVDSPVVAYGLVLFRRGTSLARIYSLAVAPEGRGQGYAKQLMEAMESSAIDEGALFIRLEVADDNLGAMALYQRYGYEPIRRLSHYYENGHDGIRMEKRLHRNLHKPRDLCFYKQSTDFTCGPASLLMAMRQVDPSTELSQAAELNLWREATTIFMTTGHGGCSPHGLALALHRRGFSTQLYVSSPETPFLRSVRDAKKRQVVESIHQDFMQQIKAAGIPVKAQALTLEELRQALDEGFMVVLLISTWHLNRIKAPHWVWLVHMDRDHAYINDPDVDEDEWQTELDNIYVPVPLERFAKMMRYGSNQYCAAVLFKA